MTKKLEQLLDLESSKEIINKAEKQEESAAKVKRAQEKETLREIAEFDKITAALPTVKGLGELGDDELNEVAQKAMDAYDDLMDLGMNVEARYSARIFEVASSMLKTNLDAKTSKLEKKLKMVELQLKKEKQDKESKPKGDGDDGFLHGEGEVITDRNSLLEKLKAMDKGSGNDK
jgi:hypothetical protein